MSVGAVPRPDGAAISRLISAARDLRDQPENGGWVRLREISQAYDELDVQASDAAGELARVQAAADLASQNERIDRGALAPRYRKSAARFLDEARACVVDTAVATLGGSAGTWHGRVALGVAPESVAAPIRAAVTARAITFGQGCALVRELDDPEVTPEAGQKVCDAVLEYATEKSAATGAPVGQGAFCRKKRREMVKHVSTRARRARAVRQRDAWVTIGEDGTGSFGVSGADARCLGAFRRVDAIARAARAGGDPRTLAQLRSDAALDLLLFGQPHADAPTSVDHPGDGGWPAAKVSVVVSLGSLCGLNEEPGTVEGHAVDADTVRDVAFAAGSTWQRLVADPITGYAMAQVSKSYAPPPRMARAVRDRDGVCRAPGCAVPAARCQLDHVVEVRDGGTTRGDTIADGCERHHAKKTRRHWAAWITPDGVIEWRLPDGRIYPTFPMDYREFGLHIDALADESASSDAAPGDAAAECSGVPSDEGRNKHCGARTGVSCAEGRDEHCGERSGAPCADSSSDPLAEGNSEHPGDRPPRKVLINAEDLQAIDDDAVAHPRELNRLRDEITRLRDELAAERATRIATEHHQALGAEPPPF